MPIRRRDLFGLGSAAGALGLLVDLAWPGAKRNAAKYGNGAPLPQLDIDCASDSSAATTGYARQFVPPSYLAAGSRDAFHTPPPWSPGTTDARQFDLSVVETT